MPKPEPYRPHISSQFDGALRSLREKVLMMSALTERTLGNAQTGLIEHDVDHCNRAIADDAEIDILEREISAEATNLILRFQPVALDLRIVVVSIKISVNLERIADQAVAIARRARKLQHMTAMPDAGTLSSLFTDSARFQRQVIDSFLNNEALSPNYLQNAHSRLMRKAKEYGDFVTKTIPYENEEKVNALLELMYIAKLLEQIADLCRDIGADTQYAFNPEFRLGGE
ncbi:MAG: phosphate uptake regulator PhoU [Verrucomicrobium sp.]